MSDDNPFLTADKFFQAVEELVQMDDISYIESTVKVCESFGIDVEDVHKLKLINASLKDRLQMNGMTEGYLKKEAQLPI